MPKKTDLMEENEFLSEETMEGECVVLQDETGRMLTEEEAVLEEERLLMKIDNFFLANPSFPQMEAEEEEEDEEDELLELFVSQVFDVSVWEIFDTWAVNVCPE